MSDSAEMQGSVPRPERPSRAQRRRGVVIPVLGLIAIAAPFLLVGLGAFSVIGVLLFATGLLEALQGFGADSSRTRRASFVCGSFSMIAGLLVLARPILQLSALALLLAITFISYGVTKIAFALRRDRGTGRHVTLFNGVLNLLLGTAIGSQWKGLGLFHMIAPDAAGEFHQRPVTALWALATLTGVRILAIGWSFVASSRPKKEVPDTSVPTLGHPDRSLKLPDHVELARIRTAAEETEQVRRSVDAYWYLVFVATFFAIHIGRMSAEWTLVGLLSPAVAVLGDIVTALLIAFAIILPCRLAWRKLTRPLERRLWQSLVTPEQTSVLYWLPARLSRRWLERRFRFSLQVNRIFRSPWAALRWGLHVGLPLTAVLVATNPIWGFSWYFNTENWAAEVWHQWAEQRTDAWREAMVKAIRERFLATGGAEGALFRIQPDGLPAAGDFSFLVIGDTGTGDPSQQALRDQFVVQGRRPDVKFMVIASDVIYPSGAMHDYEHKFYLPFKGFPKPIYAIPGNHDWYDALEGFSANFLEPISAAEAMRARVNLDHGLTTTTDRGITALIDEAARLRRAYGLQTGLQRGPYFEIQTDRFALIMVDTGVIRGVDALQRQWLEDALARARGKFTMVIPGHPLFAGGRYQADLDSGFGALHQLLREHQVDVVMAGDTHYFEYYKEPYENGGGKHVMHHFVNGEGGAYLSIGTPLDWPRQPALPDAAFYPSRDQIIEKLDNQTPLLKQPLWFWVKRLGAWPSSAEAMAAAFNYNWAPLFQSFVEVRVENSARRVRILPYGVSRPLHWRDLEAHGRVIPEDEGTDNQVEFRIPMRK